MEEIDESLRTHMSENEKKARDFIASGISGDQLNDEKGALHINAKQVVAHVTKLFDRNPNLVL